LKESHSIAGTTTLLLCLTYNRTVGFQTYVTTFFSGESVAVAPRLQKHIGLATPLALLTSLLS